jgi:hypothetical protein
MPNLHSVIQQVRCNQADDKHWLYVAEPIRQLTLETEAELGFPDIDESSGEEIAPLGYAERGLQNTIDMQSVESCIDWADHLSDSQDDKAVVHVLRYYILFDAWPDTLNAHDPPSPEESLRQIDREFCDKLGPEDATKQCRHVGCSRGVVKLSVFCRRHHFENIQKRPYPFDD